MIAIAGSDRLVTGSRHASRDSGSTAKLETL
jgi:hypothetical protein